MSDNAFDAFLREWCERQGAEFRPDMVSDAEVRYVMLGEDERFEWADVPGTDENELAMLDRACEDENAN